MNRSCSSFRRYLMDEWAGELHPDGKAELQAHLQQCPACRREQERLQKVAEDLANLEDLPVPRHFFVYPGKASAPRGRLTGRAALWKGALAAAALLVVVVSLPLLDVRVAAHDGVLALSFGRPLPPLVAPETFRNELLALVEGRLQEVQTGLEEEWSAALHQFRREETARVDRLVEGLQGRWHQELRLQEALFREAMKSSLLEVYTLLEERHRQDMLQVGLRLEEMAVRDQVQATRSRAIVATLKEMADFRWLVAGNPR